jgi:hypothetical protein
MSKDPEDVIPVKPKGGDGTESPKGIPTPIVVEKVSPLSVKGGDDDKIKSCKTDVINSQMSWHDAKDKEDADGNVYDFTVYSETLKIALDSLLKVGEIDLTSANKTVLYLSDGRYEIKSIDASLGTEGIIIDLIPSLQPEPKPEPPVHGK